MTTAARDTPMATAQACARAAADRAGVSIRDLVDPHEVDAAARLFDEVWAVGDGPSLLPGNLARAMSHAGSFLAGAFSDETIVGAALGFVGYRGGMHLHSHVLGVRPGAERAGVGFALKQHQRAWSLEHGIDIVSWTFDPLVRRNAYFNLTKLGAELSDYYVNFYGEMNDGLNAGDESDRALVTWRLESDRAIAASSGEHEEPDVSHLLASGGTVALDEDGDGKPVVSERRDEILLCRIPADIVAIRRTDPALALSWRKALRETLGSAISNRYVATGMTKSGWFVLERSAR